MDKKVIAPFLEVFLDELPIAKRERKRAHVEGARRESKNSEKKYGIKKQKRK